MSIIKPFTEEEKALIADMQRTWYAIAPDALELCEDGEADRETVVELVCDANRISMFGDPETREASEKLMMHLYCNDDDRYKEICVEAFPHETYI